MVKQVCAVATAVKVLHSSQHFDLQLYNSSKWCSSFGQTSLPDVASRYGEWLVCGASLKWPSWLHFISSRNCCMVPREVCFKYSTEKKNIGFHVQQQATKLTPCSNYWYTAYGTNYFAYYLWGDIGLHVAYYRPFSTFSMFRLMLLSSLHVQSRGRCMSIDAWFGCHFIYCIYLKDSAHWLTFL